MKRIALATLLAASCLALLQPGANPAPPAPTPEVREPSATIELAQSVPCPNRRCAR